MTSTNTQSGFTQHYFAHAQNSAGFIALTATIIIGAVLLVLISGASTAGFHTRFALLDTQLKEVSRALAESCVNVALLEHTKDTGFIGDTTVFVDGEEQQCDIVSVSGPRSAVEVRTYANFRGAVTNLEVTLDGTNEYRVSTWREVPNF